LLVLADFYVILAEIRNCPGVPPITDQLSSSPVVRAKTSLTLGKCGVGAKL
jgi:hypothetical protein